MRDAAGKRSHGEAQNELWRRWMKRGGCRRQRSPAMAALLGRSVQSLAGGLEAAAGDGSEGGAHPWRQGANAPTRAASI